MHEIERAPYILFIEIQKEKKNIPMYVKKCHCCSGRLSLRPSLSLLSSLSPLLSDVSQFSHLPNFIISNHQAPLHQNAPPRVTRDLHAPPVPIQTTPLNRTTMAGWISSKIKVAETFLQQASHSPRSVWLPSITRSLLPC